jgi:uncharacterized membrane protein HdeD (DUF308 family)
MANEFGTQVFARYWWAIAVRGAAALAFGILAFLMPALTLVSLVLFLAAYLIVDAIFSVIAGFRSMRQHQRWWVLVLEGVVDAVAAVLMLVWPGLTALVLVWVVAVWAIFTGVTSLVTAAILPMAQAGILQVLSGAISIALGIAMIALPFFGALAVVYWIAAYAVVFGIFQLTLSFRLYRYSHPQLSAPV